MSILYFFIDGIGIGKPDSSNPFHLYAHSLFRYLASQIPTDSLSNQFLMKEIDAHMGMPGLPQSATGQTSLWTGVNGPSAMGRHFTGFPGPTLRKVIYEHSMIKKFVDAGLKSTLLNGYSRLYLDRIENQPRLMSASTHLQKASGQELLTTDDVRAGRAMYMDITHEMFQLLFPDRKEELPVEDAVEQGKKCMSMARSYDLCIFEYFLTDKAGHNQSFDEAEFTIRTIETFLTGLIEEMDPARDTIIITSDHGNMEDLSTKSHTANRVPLFVAGKLRPHFEKNMTYLYDIPRRIYEMCSLTFDID